MKRIILSVLIMMIGTAPSLSQNDNGYTGKYIPRKYISDLKKPTVVMLTASWCGPCKVMKTQIMEVPEVKSCLDSLNVLIIDIDQNDGKIYREKFTGAGYEGAIPYFALLDTRGNHLDHFSGSADEQTFLTFLRKAFATDKKTEDDENK